MKSNSGKKRALAPVKLLIALSPLLWVISRIDAASLFSAIDSVAWWTMPAVLLITVAVVLLQALRWWLLIFSFQREVSYRAALAAHFKGLFYSLVLPTGAAQEILRAAILSKRTDYRVVWGASWLCKIFGVLSLIILSLFGLAGTEHASLPRGLLYTAVALLMVVGMLISLSFSKTVTRRLRPASALLLPGKVEETFAQIRQSVFLYRDRGTLLFFTAALSFGAQLALVLNSCLLIKGVAGIFPITACLSFVPIIMMSTMLLPLAPNGVGAREALLALFFRFLNLSVEELGIYIFLNLCVILLVKTFGVLPVLLDRRE